MSGAAWIFRNVLWGPLCAIIAFVPLLCINVLQMCSIVLLPFSRPLFRAVNVMFARGIWTLWSYIVEDINRTKIVYTGDVLPLRENAIVFSNHQSMSDIIVLLSLARRSKMVGRMKWLVKDVIKYVPGVGWGMLFLDCVFLKRNWADDERNITRTFRNVVDNKLRVWLVSFPEGTRITPVKLAASQAFAAKRGMVPPSNVMLPRPKGFAASVIGLREHVGAVYSVTIKYDRKPESLWALINGEIRRIAIDTKRIPIAALPRDEEGISQWLMHEFYRKDALMAQLE